MSSSSSSLPHNGSQFHQEYAKALAGALRENESLEVSPEHVLRDAYIALCHDDPLVESDKACQALAACLTKEVTNHTKNVSNYRLSDRLVEGIRQATSRTERNMSIATTPLTTTTTATPIVQDTIIDQQPVSSSSSLIQGVATGTGYATLAAAVFIKIPLQCCQSTSVDQMQTYLGSYRGPSQRHWHEPSNDTLDNVNMSDRNISDDHHDTSHDSNVQDEQIQALSDALATSPLDPAIAEIDNPDDSMQEIWAAESDPSDYEYESGHDPHHHQQIEFDHWNAAAAALDPHLLSQPPGQAATLRELQHAISNLVAELSYSKLFAALSPLQWKSLDLSNLLTQLTLTLLVQPDMEDLRHLGIQPLFVLRDRLAARQDVATDYLQLLQSLIAVHAAASSAVTMPTTTANNLSTNVTTLAPATIVGLSGLSALCQETRVQVDPIRLRQCVLETVEDLAHWVETESPNSVRWIWTLLPLLDRLTNTKPDGTILESICKAGLTTSDAQLLLQSGLFRACLLQSCRKTTAASPNTLAISEASHVARVHLLRSLQLQCLQSLNVLGKYAWRVPELTRVIHSMNDGDDDTVDSLIWNLLGTHLLTAESSVGTTIRFKQSKNVPAPPVVMTLERCRDCCLQKFHLSCTQMVQCLSHIQAVREGLDSTLTPTTTNWKELVEDFVRFTNLLVSCPALATLWNNLVSTTNQTTTIPQSIDLIQTALSQLPRVKTPPLTVSAKSADNDKAGEPRVQLNYEEQEAAIRKSVKVLSLSLHSPEGREINAMSSKTD